MMTLAAAQRYPVDAWPLRQFSRNVTAGGINWHVQIFGEGPVALLIHGTGASTHSWQHLGQALSQRYRVVVCDLPGHALSGPATAARMTLPGMAQALAALVNALELVPQLVVGHSAGAAIAVQMSLEGAVTSKHIVSINGAFLPFSGLAGHLFAPLAQIMANNPFVPKLVSWRAQRGNMVKRLLQDTGSALAPQCVSRYERLISDPSHVAGALGMMANWDLPTLAGRLGELDANLLLIAGDNDKTVPPAQAVEVAALLKSAALVKLPGLGHLAHEEDPAQVLGEIEKWYEKVSGVVRVTS